MKKILIVSNNLEIGGVQKSFIEFCRNLENLDNTQYEFDILIFNDKGPLKKELPRNLNYLQTNNYLRIKALPLDKVKTIGYLWFLYAIILKLWSKLFNNKIPFKLLDRKYKLKKYDTAISFVHSNNEKLMYFGCNEFVLNKVIAKNKIAFIHCDYKYHDGNTVYNNNNYMKFDKIIGVSQSVANQFKKYVDHPDVTYLYNFVNIDKIINDSTEFTISYKYNKINFLTVSRLSDEKGLDKLVKIFYNIKQKTNNFTWTIVGGGNSKNKIVDLIENYELTSHINLTDEQINPYPYFVNADYFILPSLHEAAPIVFFEAATLDLPIISTSTLSAKELVDDLGLGIVVDNESELQSHLLNILKNNFQENKIRYKEIIVEHQKESLFKLEKLFQ